MIIFLIKEQSSEDYIKEMEKKYESIEKLNEVFKKTKRSVFHVDLENWKYLIENPDEMIKIEETIFTDNLNLGETEIEILNMIKDRTPKSIRELAKITKKDISTIQPKVKKMEKEGLIELKEGNKNSKIPVVNYDKIEIVI